MNPPTRERLFNSNSKRGLDYAPSRVGSVEGVRGTNAGRRRGAIRGDCCPMAPAPILRPQASTTLSSSAPGGVGPGTTGRERTGRPRAADDARRRVLPKAAHTYRRRGSSTLKRSCSGLDSRRHTFDRLSRAREREGSGYLSVSGSNGGSSPPPVTLRTRYPSRASSFLKDPPEAVDDVSHGFIATATAGYLDHGGKRQSVRRASTVDVARSHGRAAKPDARGNS